VYSEEGGGSENDQNYKCTWKLEGNRLTIAYEGGEVELFEYSNNLSFSSVGRQGGAPGFAPLENGAYPITDSQPFWRSQDVEKLMQEQMGI
jgi:hypothetical protein